MTVDFHQVTFSETTTTDFRAEGCYLSGCRSRLLCSRSRQNGSRRFSSSRRFGSSRCLQRGSRRFSSGSRDSLTKARLKMR